MHAFVRPLKRTPSFLLALALATLAPSMGHAAAIRCEPVRPPGLSAATIDKKVLETVATMLHRPPNAIDTSRPLRDLDDGSAMAQAGEFAIVLQIGNELGFDGVETYRRAAPAVDGKPSIGRFSVQAMQELARTTYFAGTDAPPRAAAADVVYAMSAYDVATPRPAEGWTVVTCQFDKVTFRKTSPDGRLFRSAMANHVTRPVFTSDAAMTQALQDIARSFGPDVIQDSIKVRAEDDSPGHCHVLDLAAVLNRQPYRMRVRSCYDTRGGARATAGSSVSFSQLGTIDEADFDAAADRFMAGVVEHVGARDSNHP